LRRIAAYQIQVKAKGGLGAFTRKQLLKLAARGVRGKGKQHLTGLPL